MSVHLLINALGTSPGGASVVWAALVAGIVDLNRSANGDPFRVTLVSNHPDVAALIENADAESGTTSVILVKGGSLPSEFKIIRDIVTRTAPDVVLTHNRMSFGFSGPQIAVHINQIRFERGWLARGPKQIPLEVVRDLLSIRSLRSASANVFESAFLQNAAAKHYPHLTISNPSYAYVGIEASWLRSPEEAFAPPADECHRILSVTSPNIHKDNPTLIRALAHLVSSGDPNWQLSLAGGSSPTVWDPLMALATELGVADRVELLGFLKRDQLKAELDRTTVLASPSLIESFAMVPLEAMARGVPAVVTDATSMPESVGDAGIVVPTSDPVAMAEAISGLVDSAKWQDVSVRSRRWAATMTWNTFARDITGTIQDVLT